MIREEEERQMDIPWAEFNKLIEYANSGIGDFTGAEVREILEFGTPAAKLSLIEEHTELDFKKLVEIHRELSKISYKGSIPWWFW